MLELCFVHPGVLAALMGMAFAPFQYTIYPEDASAKPSTVSYLWSVGFGANPSTDVLSNELIISVVELTVWWLDIISQKK